MSEEVKPITKYAVMVYLQLKRLERRIMLKEMELNEVVRRIPQKDLGWFIEQTKMIDESMEKKMEYELGR